MITAMNKYLFLIYHREYETFLEKLRTIGVVHIRETKATKDVAELQELLNLRKEIAQTKRMLASYKSENAPAEQTLTLGSQADGEAAMQDAQALFAEETRLKNAIHSKKREVEHMEVWGQFDFASIERLRKAGYEVNFYSSSSSGYKTEWEEKFGAVPINTVRSTVHFITIGHKQDAKPDAERIKLPDHDLATLRQQQEELEAQLEANAKDKTAFADNRMAELTAYDKLLSDKFAFTSAMVQAEGQADDKLMLLEGWVPVSDASTMEQALAGEGYYVEQMQIEEGDKVPIKLKNNFFARLFEPITKMYSLPNYGELDPTPFLAPFFMLFFGLCFGDGGYGLLILLASTLFKGKAGKDLKPILTLFQWLGGATTIIGLLTGSFFGIALAEVPQLASIKKYFLNQDNLMTLSVVIGLIQIIYAKVLAGIKIKIQRGVKYSLATFAWAVIITAVILAFTLPMIAPKVPEAVINVMFGIAVAGGLVAFFYNSPGKNPFVNFGSGLWTAYNTASGLLGDTLSYIRLFAIGLTGSILGGVFNTLATDMTASMSIVPRIIVMLIILLIGHGLNFGLTMISSLVHPIRLTFVEFYKNSEFEGGGNQYTPFKRS